MKKRAIQVLAGGAVLALAVALMPTAAATAASAPVLTSNGNIYNGYGYTLKADGSPSGIAKFAGTTPYDEQLSFSPDGGRIAFQSQATVGAPTEVFTANKDFTARKKIVAAGTQGFERAGAPAWSPDGKKIAVVLSTYSPSSQRIALVNADGTGLVALPNSADLAHFFLSWYPDSGRLLYINSERQLCTLSTTTGSKSCYALPSPAVTGAAQSHMFTEPELSRDGTSVLMLLAKGDAANRWDIVRMSPTGTNYVNVTANVNLSQAQRPVWSPDGSTILFANYSPATNGQPRLALIAKNGTNLRVLPQRVDTSTSALAWQPVQRTVATPSALTVERVGYCGNNGGTYAWLDLKATWKADSMASVASYRLYENGTYIKNIRNTRLNAGTLSTAFSSSQWWAQDAKTLIYTVKGVTAAGVETDPSNTVTINVPALDC